MTSARKGKCPATRNCSTGWRCSSAKTAGTSKQTVKRIVMSATYQQTSQVDPSLYRRDPENRLLARGSRFRLDAEMLRDQALAVSGLLVDKLGGPSVKPPQPDGLWFAVGYSGSNTVRFQARCRSGEGASPHALHVHQANLSAAAVEHVRCTVA